VKVGAIVAGGVLVVLVLAAAAFYLLAMPGRLASDFKEDAGPEQREIRQAMAPVYRSLSLATFYVDESGMDKAKNEDQFVRAVDKATSKALRRLEPVSRQIDSAKRALEDADEEALTEVPEWPLLDGRGDLEDAEEVAEEERDYLPEARAFLKRYDALVTFWMNDVRALRRFGVAIGRGFESIPDNPGSPAAVTRPLERMARELESQMRRETARLIRFFAREIRGLATAVRQLDLGRIESFDDRIDRGIERSDAEVEVGRLVSRSKYAREIRTLRARERKIQRGLRGL
jgi:hypothetical protein